MTNTAAVSAPFLSNVEPEINYIAIANDVILSFQLHLPRFFRACSPLQATYIQLSAASM